MHRRHIQKLNNVDAYKTVASIHASRFFLVALSEERMCIHGSQQHMLSPSFVAVSARSRPTKSQRPRI